MTVPELAEQDFSDDVNNGTIKKTYACDLGGSVAYDGKVSDTLTGTIAMNYQNCWLYSNGVAISGSTAIAIESVSDSAAKYSMYFDSLTWNIEKYILYFAALSDTLSMAIAVLSLIHISEPTRPY